jgi:hypothetical protein
MRVLLKSFEEPGGLLTFKTKAIVIDSAFHETGGLLIEHCLSVLNFDWGVNG